MTCDSRDPILSVVIPAYNEAGRISVAIQDLRKTLVPICGESWELLVVDDGSTDATVAVVRDLSAGLPSLRLISHPRNLGKGAAVRTGVLAAAGSLILFADADGATPFCEYRRLLAALTPDVQMVVGSRQRNSGSTVRRSPGRAILGGLFRGLVRMVLSPAVNDTQCGFKLFRREIGQQLFSQSTENGFLFDLEILSLARRRRIVVREVPVDWHEVSGSRVRWIRDSWRMLVGLFRIRRRFTRMAVENSPIAGVELATRTLAATTGIRHTAAAHREYL